MVKVSKSCVGEVPHEETAAPGRTGAESSWTTAESGWTGAERARFRGALLAWFGQRARDLRFRSSSDPWAILVAEVMAQQTQVARVESVWVDFLRLFPTPRRLAEAPTGDALRAWAGLGYNRRAVLLQRAARVIVDEHAGDVPKELAQLESLPGVGPYTARAVAAIAFGRPEAAVDTNVRRVVTRLLGRPDAAPRDVQASADSLVDRADPASWTHALMDLGATVCRVRSPRCAECPLKRWCASAPCMPVGAASLSSAALRGVARAAPRAPARGGPVGRGPFELTSRWLRGRIVAHLRDLDGAAWGRLPETIGSHDQVGIAVALEALERDGLVERRADGAVRLPSSRP